MPSDSHDVAECRRHNMAWLHAEFARSWRSPGENATGVDGAFCQAAQIHPTMLSHLRAGRRSVGDQLARQIERAFDKPAGWMDEMHALAQVELTGYDLHCTQELVAALSRSNSKQKRALLALLRAWPRDSG